MVKKYHQITVIGPIASGKTTASQFLSKELNLPLLDADLYETNPFLPGYIEDTPRWSFATELFFTLARIKKLKNIKELLTQSSIIVDSGLIMSHHVYTKNHLVQGTMTASEWEFFTRIVDDYQSNIPSPDIIINVIASPKVQLSRIKSRGRSFESGYNIKYLESITDRITDYTESLSNNKDTIVLSINSEEHDLVTESGQKKLKSILQPYIK